MSNAGLLNPFGNGGRPDTSAYYRNLDKNLVLSASDMGKTITIITSNGYAVLLPDARQLTKQVIVNIVNKSSVPITLYNNNTQILKTIPVNQSIICWCTKTTTSSGVWAVTIPGSSLMNSIGIGALGTFNAVQSIGSSSICSLTSTVAIAIYAQATNTCSAILLTVSGSTITAGNIITLGSHVVRADCVSRISNTAAVASWSHTSGSALAYISYNGSVISSATAITLPTAAESWGTSCVMLTATSGIVAYTIPLGGSLYIYGKGFTISGSTITLTSGELFLPSVGTVATHGAAYLTQRAMCAIDATTAVLIYNKRSDSTIQGIILTPPSTVSTPVQIATSVGQALTSVFLISSTQCIILYESIGWKVALLTLPSFSVTATASITSSGSIGFQLAKLSSTQFLVQSQSNASTGTVYTRVITVSGSTISFSPEVITISDSFISDNNASITAMSGTTGISITGARSSPYPLTGRFLQIS